MKKLMGILGLSLLVTACAHHRDVRPGADGINRVVIQTADSEEGARSAISQANNYCEESNRKAAFINEDQKYTGDMDEQDYKNVQKISKVAKTVGGAVWALGGKQESNVGGIVGLGGAAGDAAIGKGYTIEMKFKCQ